MYIDTYMTTEPLTIDADTSIAQARELLNSRKFRHLPVVDNAHKLIGMVTDRDLRSAFPSSVLTEEEKRTCVDRLSNKPVSSIMSTTFVTLNPDSTLDDALLLFDRERVGALPVIDEEQKVIGIFSIRDLMKAYKTLYGIGEHGSSLVVIKDDGRENPLTRIVRTLEEHHISFTRLISSQNERQGSAARLIYLRVNTFNLSAVHKALAKSGFTVTIPQFKD